MGKASRWGLSSNARRAIAIRGSVATSLDAPSQPDLRGRTALITGANAGIGLEASVSMRAWARRS